MELWRRHRGIGNMVVGALVGLFLVLLVWNNARTGAIVQAIREQQKTNTGVATETHNTTALIESCVRPSGKCYKRAQGRTADAVANINRVVILAAACAVDIPPDISVDQRQVQIQNCVIQGLARQER